MCVRVIAFSKSNADLCAKQCEVMQDLTSLGKNPVFVSETARNRWEVLSRVAVVWFMVVLVCFGGGQEWKLRWRIFQVGHQQSTLWRVTKMNNVNGKTEWYGMGNHFILPWFCGSGIWAESCWVVLLCVVSSGVTDLAVFSWWMGWAVGSRKTSLRSTQVAQSVEHQALGFRSGHDLSQGPESEPHPLLSAGSLLGDSLPLPLPLPLLPHTGILSLE